MLNILVSILGYCLIGKIGFWVYKWKSKYYQNLFEICRYYLNQEKRLVILKESYDDYGKRKKHIDNINRVLSESRNNAFELRRCNRSAARMFILDDLSRLYLEKLIFDLRCNVFLNYIRKEKSGVDLC